MVACIPFSPNTFALGPRDYVSRFLTLFSTLRSGQTRYLPLLIAKVSDVLPNLPLPRSINAPQNLAASGLGSSSSGVGVVLTNVNEDSSSQASVSSPPYPSTDLIRQLAAQTGAQLPFTSHQSLLHAPSSRVEDLSLYDSPGTHSATHSSGSAPTSQSATPGQSHTQLTAQAHPVHGQVAHVHPHLHGHSLDVDPTSYDPRFTVQGFPVGPSMGFKQEGAGATAQMQGQPGTMYPQGSAGRGGLSHSRGGYAG